MIVTRLREEKEPQVNQGNTLNAEVGNLKGDRTHCRQRVHMRSPRTCDPDPCRCGETHTVPAPYTWGHTSTLTRVTHLPRPCTWGHTSPWSGHHGSAGCSPNMETSWVPGTSWDGKKVSGGSPFPTLVPQESSSSHFGSV